jgi:hypothetical protein
MPLCATAVLTGCASRPVPIAYHPITIDAQCAQREEDGFREDARLAVDDNRVRALDWQLWVGARGTCGFSRVELVAKDGGGCKLMVWQEPGRITLAHTDCEARCTAGIYDEAWPGSFDSAGGCAVVH